jgi:predicted Zn-dependent protease
VKRPAERSNYSPLNSVKVNLQNKQTIATIVNNSKSNSKNLDLVKLMEQLDNEVTEF